MGLSPEDRLETRMWIARIEENILIPMGEAFRFGHMYEFFKVRTIGHLPQTARRRAQTYCARACAHGVWVCVCVQDRRPGTLIPEAVDGCKLSTATGIKWMEAQLADGRDWLAGERFSLADMRLFVVYSFYSGQVNFLCPLTTSVGRSEMNI